VAVQIQFRNDTSANWQSYNPVLGEGEIGIEMDTKYIKIGDGVTAWNSLEYGPYAPLSEIDGGNA